MSASVSYANVVASGATTPVLEAANPATPVSPVEAETQAISETTSEEVDSKDQQQLPSPASSPKTEKSTKPEPTVLAPAPVPSISAWGSTAPSSAESSRSNSNIDTRHWPSAVESKGVTLKQQDKKKKTPAVKVGNEKWVPFKASVVISQPGSKKPTNNKRNAASGKAQANNNRKSAASAAVSTPSQSTEGKKKGKKTSSAKPIKEGEEQEEPLQTKEQEQKQSLELEQEQQPQEEGDLQKTEQQTPEKQHNINHHKQHRHHSNQHHHQQQQPYQPGQPFFPNKHYHSVPFAQKRFNKYQNNFNRQFNPNHQPQQNYRNFRPNHYHSNRTNEPMFSLVKQVEYYLSVSNLVKDIYLRKHMNSAGWVPLSVIAGFYRMNVLSGGDSELVIKAIESLNGSVLEMAEFENGSIYVKVKENAEQWVLPVDQREEAAQVDSVLVKVIEPVAEEETKAATTSVEDEVKEEVIPAVEA